MLSTDLFYRVEISAGGVAFDASRDVISLTVEQREMGPDQLVLDLEDPYRVLSHAIQEGARIEVELGDSKRHAVVFRGVIYDVRADFPEAGIAGLTIRANDKLQELGLKPLHNLFRKDATPGDIMRARLEEYPSFPANRCHVDLGPNPKYPKGVFQINQTDLELFRSVAAAFGCLMFVRPTGKSYEDDELHVTPESKILQGAPEVVFVYGRRDVERPLLTFQASASTSSVVLPTDVMLLHGEDNVLVTNKLRAARARGDDPFFPENLADFRAREPSRAEQLERLAQAAKEQQEALLDKLGEAVLTGQFVELSQEYEEALRRTEQRSEGMSASGTALGNTDLFARTTIRVDNVGPRFSGIWLLSEVRHVLDRQGYRTEFQCRR